MSKALKIGRTILHALTCVALFVSLVFVALAACRPDWQIVNPQGDNTYRHRHGLWEDCVHDMQRRDTNEICKLKDFTITAEEYRHTHQGGEQATDDTHESKSWQLQTLILLVVGGFCIVLATLFSAASAYADCLAYRPVFKCMAVTWIVVHTCAVCLVAAAMIIFARYSYDIKERTIHFQTQTLEQVWGSSFYHGVTGCVILLISWIFALLSVIGMFFMAGGKYTYVRVAKDQVRYNEATPV